MHLKNISRNYKFLEYLLVHFDFLCEDWNAAEVNETAVNEYNINE